jgi:HK97 family phage prohead protease|tara:strand:- start:218 stop:1468 length:1251 start_codon:yes stop_codon:yes gene_type:complete
MALSTNMLGAHFGAGSELVILKGSRNEPLVIAGYASVDVVDKQNDLITLDALKEASDKFMKGDYKNVMITHSNVQVGEVINNWTDSKGNVLKTQVDDTGLFVVIKLREDIEKAREVGREIRRGNLRSFSIGGQALHKSNRYDPDVGTYKEIDKLELHEVTICEEGINPEAKFDIVKEHKRDDKMSEEIAKALEEFNDVVAALRDQVDIKKDDSMDEELMEPMMEDEEESMEAPLENLMDKAEDDDEEMLDDEENKAESVVYGHNETGQSRIDGALTGRYSGEFKNFVTRKSESINSLDLSEETLAKAYEQFKLEKEEARAYDVIKEQFENLYEQELKSEAEDIAKANYDAAAEVAALKNEFAELRKSLESNNNVIAKQVESVAAGPQLSEEMLLKMQNIGELTWEEVNELARELQE